jgi:polysaccharide pyruvyl transferase WcaK-like protein
MSSQQVIFAGAAPDSGNLGVSALCYSVVDELLNIKPDLGITVLDYGNGFRGNAYQLRNGKSCNLMGVTPARNFLKPSAMSNVQFLSKTGLLLSQTSRVMKRAKAMLDISGGDSFTDLYGPARFRARTFSKKYAAEFSVPLILLPQTYGPFVKPESIRLVKELMPRCALAYARDRYSFETMKELLGANFDPQRHKLGVDAAFILHVQPPDLSTEPELQAPQPKEVFGFNVSGLIFNDREEASSRYGISIDYPRAMKAIVEHVLKESDGEVWLIPHVLSKHKFDYESDAYASTRLRESLAPEFRGRVRVLSGNYDQCTAKGFIGKTSWFCGMRMHATIAGLSTCVPTVNVAYSDKSLGVFESAGQGDKVLDARRMDTDDLIGKLKLLWQARDVTRRELQQAIPGVKQKAQEQMRDVARFL